MSIHVDKQSPIPIYRQIEDALREQIVSGLLRPYDLIPSENELSKNLEVSPMTIRQAMGLLVKDGFAYRQRGRGTFVLPQGLVHPISKLAGFSEDMQAHGLLPGSQILLFKDIAAAQDVAELLKISVGEPVKYVKRTRLLDGHPVGIQETYLRGVKITREELEKIGSLYQIIQHQGIVFEGAQDVIEAVSATDEMSRILDVFPGKPLLRVTRVTFAQGGTPIELLHAVYRSDFYRYKISLKR